MEPRYLGLVGPAGCGKDTVAAMLKEYGYAPYAFAAPLKEMLGVVGLYEPPRDSKELNLPGFGFSFRTAAQRLGTEWARSLDLDFWVRVAEARTTNLECVVFTDVRFENEAAFIRAKGGRIIHIFGRRSDLQTTNAEHPSEAGVGLYGSDLTIDNSGSISNLRDQIDGLMMGKNPYASR